jgi:hypothetical protein
VCWKRSKIKEVPFGDVLETLIMDAFRAKNESSLREEFEVIK